MVSRDKLSQAFMIHLIRSSNGADLGFPVAVYSCFPDSNHVSYLLV